MKRCYKLTIAGLAAVSVPLTLYAVGTVDTTLQISGYGTIGTSNTGGGLAVGYNNFISAQSCMAVGWSQQLYNSNALAVGSYGNHVYPVIFSVGNGTSSADRKNAFTVSDDGTVSAAGTAEITLVTVKGGISGTPTFTPAWWSDPSYTILKSPAGTGSNTSPANVGQLKNVAKKAQAYLEARLTGWSGAGNEINSMCVFPNTENFSFVSVGQLKSMGKVFHDRLRQIGYNWQSPGTTGTLPTQPYPWTGTTSVDNSAPASIGQLKTVFGFEVGAAYLTDSDGDGMLDGWETAYFGGLSRNGTLDRDMDGVTDKDEFLKGQRPTVADGVADDSSRKLDVFTLSVF